MFVSEQNDKTALFQREFYIIYELSTKVFVGINVMKPEGMAIGFATGIITIGICQIRILIVEIIKSNRTNAAVFCNK